MDKRIIKEFSIMARNELRSQVTRMANSFGVFEDRNGRIESGNDYVIINGKTYPKVYEASYNKQMPLPLQQLKQPTIVGDIDLNVQSYHSPLWIILYMIFSLLALNMSINPKHVIK